MTRVQVKPELLCWACERYRSHSKVRPIVAGRRAIAFSVCTQFKVASKDTVTTLRSLAEKLDLRAKGAT